MTYYFQYLRDMLIAFFQDLWNFISSPWRVVPSNFNNYNNILNSYKDSFGAGGWILWVVFLLFFIGLIGGIIFLIYLGLRKYIRFVKKEIDKDNLQKQVERLNYELFQTIKEKDKILDLQVKALGVNAPQEELQDTVEEVSSRFPKLTNVDHKYKDFDPAIPEVKDLTLEQLCNSFRLFAASKLHLYYTIETVRQLFAGFATSKLIILEGISGTGKTSLAYAIGKFFMNDSSICPVQPSWKDRSELLGYYNEFTKRFNESEFLRALYTSLYRRDANFIVLDEMNLARIEYYFAEFLSIMEMPNINEWNIELINSYDKSDPKLVKEGKILIPQNVFFFGTANNDDSTFTISDKVYDRAISLFFEDKGRYFDAEEVEPMKVSWDQIHQLYEEACSRFPVSEKTLESFKKLDSFVIKNFKLAFGNRIEKQLKTFIPVYVGCGGTELDGLDFIFTNKILKKFQSLNLAFLKDELNSLESELDKLFGRNTFKMAHAYIKDLIKLN